MNLTAENRTAKSFAKKKKRFKADNSGGDCSHKKAVGYLRIVRPADVHGFKGNDVSCLVYTRAMYREYEMARPVFLVFVSNFYLCGMWHTHHTSLRVPWGAILVSRVYACEVMLVLSICMIFKDGDFRWV